MSAVDVRPAPQERTERKDNLVHMCAVHAERCADDSVADPHGDTAACRSFCGASLVGAKPYPAPAGPDDCVVCTALFWEWAMRRRWA
jgi:hypothetical protein